MIGLTNHLHISVFNSVVTFNIMTRPIRADVARTTKATSYRFTWSRTLQWLAGLRICLLPSKWALTPSSFKEPPGINEGPIGTFFSA